MTRWAMVIDLRKCIGCGICCGVCAHVNNVPSGSEWRRLVGRTLKDKGSEKRLFVTMSCMQCDDPSCVTVCPTKATFQRKDGIVDIDQKFCIGCAACVLACPYKARSINDIASMSSYEKINDHGGTVGIEDKIGICTKCNFCLPVIENGLKKGLRPGIDPEATPKCVRNCPCESLIFGDLHDPESPVAKSLKQNKAINLLEELGTNPQIYYIPDNETK